MLTNWKEGQRVKVLRKKLPAGMMHPHVGKTGVITELLGIRIAIGKPRAMVRIDEGCENAGCTMIVSLEYLEVIA